MDFLKIFILNGKKEPLSIKMLSLEGLVGGFLLLAFLLINLY